jgi:anti-sigma factor RsiW
MSCPEYDLKGFVLKELAPAEASATGLHVEGCDACREEAGRLAAIFAALNALPSEEPPRRIAFVSDKVFEPKWWQVWLNSGPRMAFVSSAMLAAAILTHGAMRPAPAPVVQAFDTTAIEARLKQAVAETEARQAVKLQTALAEAQKRFDFEREADRVQVEEAFNVMRKQMNRWYLASAEVGGGR